MIKRISFLALKGLISEKDLLEFVGPAMVKCWDKVEDFIRETRRKQWEESEEVNKFSYMYFFQQFVTRNRKRLKA